MEEKAKRIRIGVRERCTYFSSPNLREIVTSSLPAVSSICNNEFRVTVHTRHKGIATYNKGSKRTDQIPFSRKVFKNLGVGSDRDCFSYESSSFNFWESEISAANGKDGGGGRGFLKKKNLNK